MTLARPLICATIGAALLLVLSAPAHADVDPEAIGRILGAPPANATPNAPSDRQLDALATNATKHLDQSQGDWNPANPHWLPVFAHVRADYEADLPAIVATANVASSNLEHSYEVEIAAHMSQSDVDTILAYYDTPQGQRYQAFIHRLSVVMSAGALSLMNASSMTNNGATPDQVEQYAKLLQLSHLYLSMTAMAHADQVAHRDTNGYAALNIIVLMAARRNPMEMASIAKTYADDIPAFETFTQSEALQHYFAAMGQAMPKMVKNNPAQSIGEAIAVIEKNHKAEWLDFYHAQLALPVDQDNVQEGPQDK